MKLGAIHNWGGDLEAFRSDLRLCSDLGYDFIGMGDSPAGWHELFLSMAVAVAETEGSIIVPMVTSPFMRHPLVTANGMSSLYDMSGGRAMLGFATGGSSVMSIGHAPATLEELRSEVATLKDLFEGRSSSFAGEVVKPLRFARDIPILLSAFGPKTIRLAGQIADGVILFAGSKQLDRLEQQIAMFRRSAEEAGRDPTALPVWVTSFCSVQDSREQAIDDLLAFLASSPIAFPRTQEALEAIPLEFRERVLEYRSRYDPTEHVVPLGRNAAAVRELGLAEFFADYDTVLGTPDDVAGALRDMDALGVDAFFCALPGLVDRQRTARELATIFGREEAVATGRLQPRRDGG